MPSPIRLALLGIDHPHGFSWRELLQSFEHDLQIVALVPGFGGQLASLEERLSDLPLFETAEALVDWGQFDAALVTLPNNASPQAIEQLAQAGKHLLVEKPGAANAADGRRIAEAVRQANVVFQSGYMWRYDEGAERLQRMTRQGRFGKLIALETLFVTSDAQRRGAEHYLFDPAASGGGFFNWLACHWLDLLLHVTGERVIGVTARTGVFGKTPTQVDDGGGVLLDLSGGGLATFLGGYWLPRWAGESRWTLYGSERWVKWEPSHPGTSGLLEIHGPMPQWFAMEETVRLPGDATRGYGGRRGQRLVQDWIDKIRSVGECRNTPESLCDVLELIDTIHEASRQGRRIECDIGAVAANAP